MKAAEVDRILLKNVGSSRSSTPTPRMFAVLGATVAGLLVGGAGAPGAARMPAVRMEARMHSGTFTEHTHLSMHHKVIPSSGAAAASSATDLTLRQEPTA